MFLDLQKRDAYPFGRSGQSERLAHGSLRAESDREPNVGGISVELRVLLSKSKDLRRLPARAVEKTMEDAISVARRRNSGKNKRR